MRPELASHGSLPAERRRRDRGPLGRSRLLDCEYRRQGRRCEQAIDSKRVVLLGHGGLKRGCNG